MTGLYVHNCALQVPWLTRGAAHALTWALPALEAGETTRGGDERSKEGIQLCRKQKITFYVFHSVNMLRRRKNIYGG